MVESTLQPTELYIDKIENGRARILCRWNITSTVRSDEFGTHTIWEYDESIIWWTFPYTDANKTLDNIDDITAYLIANKADILNFAKGTKVTLRGADKKTKVNNKDKKEKDFTVKGKV